MLLLASLARGELRVEGVSDEIARNVQNFVALASEPCDAETWLVRRRFRAIETEVRSALEPFGYYDPTIEKTLALDEKCWRATLRIDAGKPVVLRTIDVSIATPPEGTTDFYDIESASPLVAGTPLRHADYETLKESLQVRAAERGYADASFTRNTIDVWPDERAADISLEYESGPRYE
ncbi:MAG: POTRA domain-containing protein, partial [Woeseiaceae bacterium]